MRDRITSPQWEWNARNTGTTGTAFTAISANTLILVSNHPQADVNHQPRGLSLKGVFGWSCQNGNEASACLHLIREAWKEESGGGREQQRGRRWWRKPWLQGWRTDTRAGGQTGGQGLTCCRCCGLGLASTTDPPEGEFKGASWEEQPHQRSFYREEKQRWQRRSSLPFSPQPPSAAMLQSIHRSLTEPAHRLPPPLHSPFVRDSSLPSPVHTSIPQYSFGQEEDWTQSMSGILNWDLYFIYQKKSPKEATENINVRAWQLPQCVTGNMSH